MDVVLSSSQTGSVFDSGGAAGSGLFGGPTPIPWLTQTGGGATWFGYDFNLAAPSGATYTGSASGGVNVLGASCAATAFSIG